MEKTLDSVKFELVENTKFSGLVAQWITRLPTEQKIPGSSPGKVGLFRLISHAVGKASLFQSYLIMFYRESFKENKLENTTNVFSYNFKLFVKI